MYNPYAALARLNEASLRRCEEHFLDPDSDYDEYDRYAEDEENDGDDSC